MIELENRLNKLRSMAMNLNLIEREFIAKNSHCSFCAADMSSSCSYPFRIWMGCMQTIDDKDAFQKPRPECQRALNNYMYVVSSYLFTTM